MLHDKTIFAYYWALRDDTWDLLLRSPVNGSAWSNFLSSSPQIFVSEQTKSRIFFCITLTSPAKLVTVLILWVLR
jgi:hypothetical protein